MPDEPMRIVDAQEDALLAVDADGKATVLSVEGSSQLPTTSAVELRSAC